MMKPDVSAEWTEARFRDALTSYCFGAQGMGDDDRARIEQHLLECDTCWDEVQRLEAAVRALRSGASAAGVPVDAETVAAVKLASAEDKTFGGHLGFALLASALHGLLYVASLWNELVYAFDRYRAALSEWTLPLFVFCCAGTLGCLWLSATLGRGKKRFAFQASVLGLAALIGATLAIAVVVLPHEPIVRATIQTRTVYQAFQKNIFIHFTPVIILYVLLPFHVVLGIQRELQQGRVTNTVALLTGDRRAFHPRGLWLLRPQVLGWLMALMGIVHVVGMNYMLDHLLPGSYSTWYAAALYTRIGLWLVIAGVGLAWYHRQMQDLRQLALLLQRLHDRSIQA
jgi:hypothetical protein